MMFAKPLEIGEYTRMRVVRTPFFSAGTAFQVVKGCPKFGECECVSGLVFILRRTPHDDRLFSCWFIAFGALFFFVFYYLIRHSLARLLAE
jgi:hypothetical protein